MKKPIFLSIIVILFLSSSSTIFSRTVVFPFKINSAEKKAHQWLGRGVSQYLSYGLMENNIDTFSDNTGRELLKSLKIKFPYNVSKASIIRAGKLLKATKLVWGEITTSEKEGEDTLSIRAFTIDIERLSQKYIPVINGKITDLFSVQKKLLNDIILYTFDTETTPKIPEIKMDLRNYETFIKGLLLDDNSKRIELLERVRNAVKENQGLLLFELARTYFLNGDNISSQKILDEISDKDPFREKKFFLSGIIGYLSNDIDSAFSNFSKVLDSNNYKPEVLNNIALVYTLRNEYPEALNSIKMSVRAGMRSDSFYNAVVISKLTKDQEKAWNFLMEGLSYYPADEDMIALMFNHLAKSQHGKYITPAFLKYLPGFAPDQAEKKTFFKIANPFIFDKEKYDMEFSEENGNTLFSKERVEEDMDSLEKKLIKNPFHPENHFKLAKIYYKEEKLKISLEHAHAALYLLRNPKHFLFILKILRKQGNRDEMKDMLIEALKYFPNNENLKNFSLNSE